jgi:hypothetical protein
MMFIFLWGWGITRSEVVRKENKKTQARFGCRPRQYTSQITDRMCAGNGVTALIIFRKRMGEKCVPSDWKKAIVIPIFKKGKRTDPRRKLSPCESD